MKARIVGLCVVAGFSLVAIAPTSVAQPQSQIRFVAEWAMDHEMVLPVSGRATMELKVTAVAKDFVCAQPYKFSVKIGADAWAKWAGASFQPPTVEFEMPAGSPGTTVWSQPKSTIMDIAWDVDGRPKQNARQEYVAYPHTKQNDATTGYPCAPESSPDYVKTQKPMVVRMEDVVEQPSQAEKCQLEPYLPECQPTQTQEVGGEAPFINAGLFVLSLLGLAVVLRRRRA